MRIAVVANTSWYLFNFRLNLMRALEMRGHQIVAVGPADDYVERIVAEGFRHVAVPFTGIGVNPLREFSTLSRLARVFRKNRIEAVLSYTPKGNIYSGLACITLGIPTLPNISGLGRAFIRPSVLTTLVKFLYWLTLRRSPRVFFQNNEDLGLFVGAGLVTQSRAERVSGSGVDLWRFSPMPVTAQNKSGAAVFLLVARLLWAKGIGEFVEAARLVREECPKARFQLLGFFDVENPASIPRSIVDAWAAEGLIEYVGTTDDVRTFLAAADCVVLPSCYCEGVPRSLLEAAAMGRSVITTNVPGCRDTVDDGVTGLLCKPMDAGDLADKMLRFLALDQASRTTMGQAGRRKMEREFDEKVVINRYLAAVGAIAAKRKA
jgi:glycosyltransferase involved in cell wall biosynthesis